MNNIKLLKTSTIVMTLFLAGCQNYLTRHEGFSQTAGDANAINDVKLVEDPWKQSANNKHIPSDGQRLADAVKAYKTAHDEDNTNDQRDTASSKTTD